MSVCGTCMFVLSFIIGHMIPKKIKHQAAIRTCLMLDVCLLISTIYSAYFDNRLNMPQLVNALKSKQVPLFGLMTILSIAALLTTPKTKTQ